MLLFTPGPTPTPESIRQAMSIPTLHHRSTDFEGYFEFARNSLKSMLNMNEVLLLSSSGSGAMEACVLTFCKKILCINSGKFGERFASIARAHNIEVVEIINDWDTAPSASSVVEVFQKHKGIDSVCLQICESAGGLRHNVEDIAKAIKEIDKNIIVIADGITAIGVEKIDTTNIDALIGGSQKAFMLPPGMSFIGLSPLALTKLEANNVGYYFNLNIELKNQRKNTTAWTSPISIIIGLAEYFKSVDIERIYKETKARALATRSALATLGLKIYPKSPALAMSTVYNEDSSAIIKTLKEKYNVSVGGGQDILKGKIFRVNHMGDIAINDASWVINAIELSLESLHLRKFDGEGNKVFLKHYYDNLAKLL